MKELEILITNDDSINAKGVIFLANVMSHYGNVSVVAPSEVQSGKSASLSLGKELYLREIESGEHPYKLYSFNGTPVDCVKIAINQIYNCIPPDLLVSGINHGSNASVASIYSGTLGAAAEGTIYSIPSIGFSIDTHSPDPDFSGAEIYIKRIVDQFLKAPANKDVYLNVNFPDIPFEEIKGIKMAHRGMGRWVKEFETKNDESGNECFCMIGSFQNLDDGKGDHILLEQGFVTIVPHKIDNTDYQEIERLNNTWNILNNKK